MAIAMIMKTLRTLSVIMLLTIPEATIGLASEITAFVEPYRDIDVASPEMGTLAVVQVKEGDEVVEGQVLARLDEDVLQAALNMAQTSMDARGKLRSAEAEFRLQETRLDKLLGLHTRRHASEEEVVRAKAQKEIAKAQIQAVRDELEVKQAEYQRIKAQLDQKRIKSPISGTVTLVLKDAGEFVSPSEPVVLKIVQLDPLLVVFSVPAAEARKLKVNQRVPLAIGASRDSVHGSIEFVSPTADAQSGTARVKVRIPNSEGRFQSGDGCWLQIADANTQPDVASGLTRPISSKSPAPRLSIK